MNRLLSLMFKRRGYDADYYESICQCNHPDPAHIDEMCALLKKYHDDGTQIALLTDFDMDGLMSGVVGYAGMKELGFNVVLAYPDVTTSYGINAAEIDSIKKQYPEASVLVTGDVGVTAYDGIARARELGMDVLVTDHHVPKEKRVDANVIVDPQYEDDPAYEGICGAHVLYLVLRHYARHYTSDPEFTCSQIDRLRVFAGFGTISDRMPVLYENRQLIKDALAICRTIYNIGITDHFESIPGCEMYRRAFIGLHIVLTAFASKIGNTLYEDFIEFYAAPTFNSVKRLNGSVETAYSVFFSSLDDARKSMNVLMKMNKERKECVERAYSHIHSTHSPYEPFLYVVDTTPGLCGLLAQKLCEESGYPTVVVIKKDQGYEGSGRSPEWYPFLKYANGQPGWEAAGHEGAFGISFKDDSALEAYVSYMTKDVEEKKASLEVSPQPDLIISSLDDGDVGIDLDMLIDYLAELEEYHPFGPGFEKPRIVLRFNSMQARWSFFGGQKHVQAKLHGGLDLKSFNQGDYFNGCINPGLLPEVTEVEGDLVLNTFKGITTLQFIGKLPYPPKGVIEIHSYD